MIYPFYSSYFSHFSTVTPPHHRPFSNTNIIVPFSDAAAGPLPYPSTPLHRCWPWHHHWPFYHILPYFGFYHVTLKNLSHPTGGSHGRSFDLPLHNHGSELALSYCRTDILSFLLKCRCQGSPCTKGLLLKKVKKVVENANGEGKDGNNGEQGGRILGGIV